MEKGEARKQTEAWEAAKARAEKDPDHGRTLAQELLKSKRALTDDDVADLIHDRVVQKNVHKAAMDDVAKAIDSGDGVKEIQARLKMKDAEERLELNAKAAGRARSETGRGLSALRMLANDDDMSLAANLTRAKVAAGHDLTESQRATIERLTAERDAAIKERDAAQTATESAPKLRIARTPAGKKALDDQLVDLQKRLAEIAKKPTSQPEALYSKDEVIAKIGPEAASVVNAMAKNRVMAGVDDPNELVSQVHDAVKDALPISERDVSDLISGYGHLIQPNKNEIQTRLNAIKSQLRESARKQDAAAGKKPIAHDAVRQNALEKEAAKLQKALDTGNFSKEKRQPPVYNEETLAKQAKVDKLRDQINREVKRLERQSRGGVEKVTDFIVNAHRGMLLTSPIVVPKLLLAAVYRTVFTPAEQAIGSGLRLLPGLSKIAAKAPREGAGFSLNTEARAMANAWGPKAFREAWETARTGMTDRSALYKDTYHDPTFVSYIGNIHSALKTPAKRAEFMRSLIIRSNFERSRVIAEGMSPAEADAHMADPET